jgi:hypothetical protein
MVQNRGEPNAYWCINTPTPYQRDNENSRSATPGASSLPVAPRIEPFSRSRWDTHRDRSAPSRELTEALIVNPYDTKSMAEALNAALRMPTPEQEERMRLMRQQVKDQNVYRWAGRMLLDAARIRQRRRVMALAQSI